MRSLSWRHVQGGDTALALAEQKGHKDVADLLGRATVSPVLGAAVTAGA
jgi:hypothetical protein